MKNLVVVLTRYWPTALSVIRSLGAAGYCVDLVASAHEEGASRIAGASKYVRRYTETVCKSVKRIDDPALLEVLLSYGAEEDCAQSKDGDTEKPVLFPTDDYTGSFIDRHRDELSSVFLMPGADGGRQGAVIELMNKVNQHRMALEAGLACPREWIVPLEGEIFIPDDMVYPCFCKLMESYSGVKSEMARCDDKKSLRRHLEKLRDRNPYRSIIIQEFLDIDEEIDLSGVCIDDRIIIPAVIRKTCIAEHEKGITVAGKIEETDVLSGILENVKKMLAACRYTGMFDMEFNLVGGRIFFGELNLRSGGPNYAYYMSGVNLPDITVRAIKGEQVADGECAVREFGRSFVYERVLWKEYLKGFKTLEEVQKVLDSSTDRFIESEDDPLPARIYYEELERAIEEKKDKDSRKKSRLRKKLDYRLDLIARRYPQASPLNARKRTTRPRVMVAGRNYCTNLCIARSLGMAGYDVEILRIDTKKPEERDALDNMRPEAYSKYVKAFRAVSMKRKSRRVADALVKYAYPGRKMLLIPTEDVAAYIVDEYLDELSRYYYVPNANNTQGGIIRLMSKTLQKEIAAGVGIPTVRSTALSIRRGKFDIPADTPYPCFIKPDVSRRARGSKKIMRKCSDEAELRAALEEIAEYLIDADLIAEEYIEVRRELSLLGLSYDGEVIMPGLFEALSGGSSSRKGVAVTGRSIPLSGLGELEENLREFVRATGYNGLLDIDLIEGEDSRIYFVELNLRYGASGYVLTTGGCNLPGMLADLIVGGKPLDPTASMGRTGYTFVSEKVLIEEYADGCLTEEEVQDMIRSADVHFIMDRNDPKPYRDFLKTFKAIGRQMKAAGSNNQTANET